MFHHIHTVSYHKNILILKEINFGVELVACTHIWRRIFAHSIVHANIVEVWQQPCTRIMAADTGVSVDQYYIVREDTIVGTGHGTWWW